VNRAANLAHPGGNLTGFYVFESSLGEELLELLKQIAPNVSRVALLSNQLARPESWTAYAVHALCMRPRDLGSNWWRSRSAMPAN
jgi:hypothetical protein